MVISEAYGSNGTITIKWDVVSWTPDGYVVSTTSFLMNSTSYIGIKSCIYYMNGIIICHIGISNRV